MNIALLSPNKNVYSETFIQAHKERLKGKIFYYFDGKLPGRLEGNYLNNSRRARIIHIVKGHFRLNKFSLEEQALITSFRKNKIDLVFAEYGGTGEKIAPVCEELKLPLIVHFHGYDSSRFDQLKKHQNYQAVFRYATSVIVVSKKMFQDLLALGCPREKLICNVYGPREEFFEVVPKFVTQDFISVGRFVDKKAPYYLILSFVEVVQKMPQARLIMAGDGNLINTCKNLVKYYGLEDRILFVGVISSGQFIKYLKNSIAYVQHSITAEDGDAEGTPVTVLEASAAGLPVISTYHAGIPDIVIHGKTGLLVQEHDVKGMANAMIAVLEDPSLARKMGNEGKKRINMNFSLDKHIAALDNLIKKTLRR